MIIQLKILLENRCQSEPVEDLYKLEALRKAQCENEVLIVFLINSHCTKSLRSLHLLKCQRKDFLSNLVL